MSRQPCGSQETSTEVSPLLSTTSADVRYDGYVKPIVGDLERASSELLHGEGSLDDTPAENTVIVHELAPALVGSAKKTFFNIVITIVGSGVLGLPYTFMRSGWLVGTLSILLSALLSYHCMMLLVQCRKLLAQRGVVVTSYGGVGQNACGDWGEMGVDFLILVSQGGCCVAYLIFIAQNLQSIFCYQKSCSGTEFILLLLPMQIGLSWVRSLTGLVPFSIVADGANLVAMGLVMRADLQNFQDLSNFDAYTGLANIPFALGVACYCFEGFAMTLPLEASMKNPKRFPFILGLAMSAITTLYLAFGLVGYVVFKEHTKEIITLNLPNDWTTITVKLGLCLGLFLTFPVMMHPVHEIAERGLARTSLYARYIQPHARADQQVKKVVRASLVIITAVLAIRVPAFAVFISLVGSSVCALIAFVLPGIFHTMLLRKQGVVPVIEVGSDVAVVLFGILFALYGTSDAVSRL